MVTALIDLFVNLIGEIPSEFESFVYVLGVFVLVYVIDAFFIMLGSIFGVTKWKQ